MSRLEEDGFTVVRIPTAGGTLDLDVIRRSASEDVTLRRLVGK